ncbi:MAG: polysaccharide export protein [Bacteroidales bacterium]|nr:polysaccharide export protein [Bacteroidales bacterium]MBQ9312597.1 polysaccharide export protein [Bacteroidales bacterium]
MMKKNYAIKITFIALLLGLFTSCTKQKNLIYFQTDKLKTPPMQVYEYPNGQTNDSPDYLLQEHDMLYVQIYSTVDDEAAKLFGSTNSTSNYYSQAESNVYLSAYEINADGNISIPTIGEVKVADLTVEQAKDLIQKKAEEYTSNVTVICKMVTFRIRVTGEVNKPGIYTFYQPAVDIYDALISAGDLTYDGDRSKVRIIRKTNTEDIVYTLDIRKTSVMRDKKYYLRPGDIVYVQPNKKTKALTTINHPLSTISYALSVVSSLASVIAIIVALKK